MKKIIFFSMVVISTSLVAGQPDSLYISAKDQKFYKNEPGMGMNDMERIDSTVKEINRLHGEISSMKVEIQQLKKEVEELKKAK